MTTKRENIACRPGTTDAMQRLADENDALRAERDGLAAQVERLQSVLTPKAVDFIRCGIGGNYGGSFYDDEMDRTYWPIKQAIDETPAQSLAHIRAAGAREALERAMQTPGFSDTVVRVDLMREIIEKMEVGS